MCSRDQWTEVTGTAQLHLGTSKTQQCWWALEKRFVSANVFTEE
jgi:hypothetical protein